MTNPNSLQHSMFPTPEIIEGWKSERARLRDAMEDLKQRHDAYDSMITAAEQLVERTPFGARQECDDTPLNHSTLPAKSIRKAAPIRPMDRTWTATMLSIIERLGRTTYEELRDEVSKTHLGKKLEQSDKSFYGGVGKLAGQMKIVRHNGWIYSAAAYRQHKKDVAAGRAVDGKAPTVNPAHHSPFGDAIKAYLGSRLDGASSSDIIAELKKTPEFFDTIERHKSHPYNVLARLVDQGELVKGGGRYFRAPNKGGQA